jgi:hypothetical protein
MGFIIIPDKLQAISVLHREENVGFCFPYEAQRGILFSTNSMQNTSTAKCVVAIKFVISDYG